MKQTDYPDKLYIVHSEYATEFGMYPKWEGNNERIGEEYVRADLMPKWHDTSKEMPDDFENVVAWNGYDFAVCSCWIMTNGTREWYCPTNGCHPEDITHWMPIPNFDKKIDYASRRNRNYIR